MNRRKSFKRRERRTLSATKPTYYYCYIKEGDNTGVYGPCETPGEAQQIGWQSGDEFKVIPLHTRDRGKATQQIKAMRLEGGMNLSEATQRMKHDFNNLSNSKAIKGKSIFDE